jgi:sulfur carrier protein
MKVKLRNPDRVVEVSGPSTVARVLEKLDIVPEAVLVIRDATLLTRDERVGEDDEIEVRPVLSGGADGGDLLSSVGNGRYTSIQTHRKTGPPGQSASGGAA